MNKNELINIRKNVKAIGPALRKAYHAGDFKVSSSDKDIIEFKIDGLTLRCTFDTAAVERVAAKYEQAGSVTRFPSDARNAIPKAQPKTTRQSRFSDQQLSKMMYDLDEPDRIDNARSYCEQHAKNLDNELIRIKSAQA